MKPTDADYAMIAKIQKKLANIGITANVTDAIRYALTVVSKGEK